MSSIIDLTNQLIESVRVSTTKTAAAVETPAPREQLPIVTALKMAADALRHDEISDATLSDVKLAFEKAAMFAQPGTGAQSPNAGGGVGSAQPTPTLPALKTTNLGVTAGSGGAPLTMKAASEATPLGDALRKLAAQLREEDDTQQKKVAADAVSILKAATSLRYLQRGIGQ